MLIIPKKKILNSSPPVDANTICLLHMNGDFHDESGKTVTVVNGIISTAQSKYGGSSGYSTATMCTLPDSAAFYLNDFTIESWVYPTTWASDSNLDIADKAYNAAIGGWLFRIGLGSGILDFVVYDGNYNVFNSSITLSLNTWQHVAASRSGSSLRIFKDGSQNAGPFTYSGQLSGAGYPLNVGGGMYTQYFKGYMNGFRISNIARYTSNFTPAAPYV